MSPPSSITKVNVIFLFCTCKEIFVRKLLNEATDFVAIIIFISCEYFITESIIEGVKEKGKTIEGKFFS